MLYLYLKKKFLERKGIIYHPSIHCYTHTRKVNGKYNPTRTQARGRRIIEISASVKTGGIRGRKGRGKEEGVGLISVPAKLSCAVGSSVLSPVKWLVARSTCLRGIVRLPLAPSRTLSNPCHILLRLLEPPYPPGIVSVSYRKRKHSTALTELFTECRPVTVSLPSERVI